MTKKSTLVVTTTRDLGAAVDQMLIAMADAKNPPSKSKMLNILAAQMAGPKHNWGFLTGAKGPVIQKGLDTARLKEISLPAAPALPKAEITKQDSDLLSVKLFNPRTQQQESLALTPADIVVLWTTMRDERAGGSITTGLFCGALVQREDAQIVIKLTPADDPVARTLTIDEKSLWAHLQDNLPKAIAAAFRSDPLAETIHTAFCVVAETDNKISSFHEDGSLKPFDDDIGTQLATVITLEEIAPAQRFEFERDTRAATDWVIEHAWTNLIFILLDEAEPEERAAQAPHALLPPSAYNPDPAAGARKA